MTLNVGYVELGGGGAVIRIYYDTAFQPVGPNQPLINGPRGYCLDVTNTTGRQVHLVISGVKDTPLDVLVDQGNPVTTGPGQSRTAAAMSAAGFTTRGSLGQVTIS